MSRPAGSLSAKLKQTSLGRNVRRAVRLWQGHDEVGYRQVEALMNLHALLQPRAPLPPTRGWAASPDVLLLLAKDVLARRPEVVVEFGSGTSSVVLGLALREAGAGTLTSFDNDPEWAARTRSALREHDLTSVVTVIDSPLGPWSSATAASQPHPTRWYSSVEPPEGIGLVFVDGPPGVGEKLARYPSFEAVRPHLLPGAKIVLDDADRADEREIVRRWVALEPGLEVSYLPAEWGICIVTVPAG